MRVVAPLVFIIWEVLYLGFYISSVVLVKLLAWLRFIQRITALREQTLKALM